MRTISVVVPTYNRLIQLSKVLDHILKSNIDDFEHVEVIVVDNDSSKSPREMIEAKDVGAPFELRYVWQENAGPAGSRNRGFREAAHEIVLFIDDDILVFPDLISEHSSAHLSHPGSIVYGQCPYLPVTPLTAAARYLDSLIADGFDSIGARDLHEFVPVKSVASGNISVEKKLFKQRDVYTSRLKMPAGEEFELAAYLEQSNIPIFFAPWIKGWHLQPATIQDTCIQNYKYGLGIAELAIELPEVLALEQPRRLYELNRGVVGSDPPLLKAKKRIRQVLATKVMRTVLLLVASVGERLHLPDKLLFATYRIAIGTHFAAGISDGTKIFTK